MTEAEKLSSSFGVYIGTFDPFHVGHLEVLQWASHQLSHILICPMDNCKKDNIYPVTRRLEWMKVALEQQTFMHTLCESTVALDEAIDNQRSQGKRMVGILGNDAAVKEPTKICYDECIIIPRTGVVDRPDPSLWSIPYTLADAKNFVFQHASSTRLREALWSLDTNTIRQLTCSEKHHETMVAEAESWLSDLAYGGREGSHFDDLEVELPDGRDHVRVVTLPTKHASTGEPVRLVIKKFFDATLQAREVAATNHFSNVMEPRVPRIIWSLGPYVIFAFAGKSLLWLFRQKKLDARQVGALAGKALAQMHSHQNSSSQALLVQNAKFGKMLRHYGQQSDLVQNFLQDPGQLTLVHGDTNLGNFTMDSQGEVYVIDLISACDAGIPSYDYYQFISSLSWNLEAEEPIDDIIIGFSESYAAHTTCPFTPSADAICKDFWSGYARGPKPVVYLHR